MFGYLQHQCPGGEYCGCRYFERGEPWTVNLREYDEDRKIKIGQFNTEADFFSYFWATYGNSSPRYQFNEYREMGCWSWVAGFREAAYFAEIAERLAASRELGIRPVETDLDSTDARLLDHLLAMSAATKDAAAYKAELEAKRGKDSRLQHKV